MVTGCNDRQQIAQAAGLGAKGHHPRRCGRLMSKAWCAKLFGARQGWSLTATPSSPKPHSPPPRGDCSENARHGPCPIAPVGQQ